MQLLQCAHLAVVLAVRQVEYDCRLLDQELLADLVQDLRGGRDRGHHLQEGVHLEAGTFGESGMVTVTI